MNITHTKMNAAAGENFCGYSLVRRIAAGCLMAAAVMTSAVAGPGDKERGQRDQRDQYRSERAQQQREYDDRQREFDSRSFERRAEDQRRAMQQDQNAQNDSGRRSGRLTPDERRDLRRQINEAGMDIYPNRQRR